MILVKHLDPHQEHPLVVAALRFPPIFPCSFGWSRISWMPRRRGVELSLSKGGLRKPWITKNSFWSLLLVLHFHPKADTWMQVTLLYLHTYHDALWNSTVDLQLKAFLFLLARAITRAGFISNVQVCLAWWKVHGFTMLNNRSSKGFVKFRPRFMYCRPCTPLKSGPKLQILQFPSAKVVDLRFPLFLATFLAHLLGISPPSLIFCLGFPGFGTFAARSPVNQLGLLDQQR